MDFNLFSKDPNSIWSFYTGWFGRPVKLLRWGPFTVIVMLAGLAGGIHSLPKDISLLHNSTLTTAHFAGITGQKPDRNSQTLYTGSFQYTAAGISYTVVESQDALKDSVQPKFPSTVQVAYKTSNPGESDILYHGTVSKGILWDIGTGVAVAIFIHFAFYAIALFRRWVGGLKH